MGRAPAKKSGKRDDRFQPAAETRRIVPTADGGFDVHTPDGKRLHVAATQLFELVDQFDQDDRTPGWFSRCASDLGLVLEATQENEQ